MSKQNIFGKWVHERHPYIHITDKILYSFTIIANHSAVCIFMCNPFTFVSNDITGATKVQNSVRTVGVTLNIV
jgi:hypothetical protein